MTVVAALIADRRVWMGADTMAYDGANVARPNPHKVRSITFGDDGRERLVFGTCGAVALGQIALHRLTVGRTPDPTDDEDCDAWAHDLATQLTNIARTRGGPNCEGMDGSGLFAWRNRLWHVTDNCALPVERFSTIGSGGEVALGALDVLAESEAAPSFIVGRAIEAACRWEGGCRAPFVLAVTDTWDTQ